MSIFSKPKPVIPEPALPSYSPEHPAPGSVLGKARQAYADALAGVQEARAQLRARQAEGGKIPQPGPGMIVSELAASKIWREAAKDSVIFAEAALQEAELRRTQYEYSLASIERQVQMFWAERAKLPPFEKCDFDDSVRFRDLTNKICSLIL